MMLPIIGREGETMNQKQGEETEILQKLEGIYNFLAVISVAPGVSNRWRRICSIPAPSNQLFTVGNG